MADSENKTVGRVVALWRYPVKSMMGEELNATEVTDRGLLGDRMYGLVDRVDGKVATAKNPRKWPNLFDFRAVLVDTPPPQPDDTQSGVPAPAGPRAGHSRERVGEVPGGPGAHPPVRIALPDGTTLTSEQDDRNQILSQALGREVTLETAERRQRGVVESIFPTTWMPISEEYWPDMEGLDYRDTVTDFELPEGTFFDFGVVHVLTTATLDRLRELYPEGRFEVRRFRPNVVVSTTNGVKDFVENGWIGHTLAMGDEVRLHITKPCSRCVMTTLAQGDLPKDTGILRTAAKHNGVNVGVYASVIQGGRVRRGDAVRLA